MKQKINLKVYNTLTRKIEKFRPINNKFIGIYNCGPSLKKLHTHIGNLRSYVLTDLIKRYFLYKGYKVKSVIKVTDVEDHCLKECMELGISLKEYTQGLFKDFKSQLKTMNILEPVLLPRVTDNIPEILNAIKKLSKKGLTYVSNGSVYLKVNKLKNYGKLVNPDKRMSLKKNAQRRIKDFVMDEKEDMYDFCLWKAYKPETDGNVFWQSEYGKGRPGWHIECSVISQKYLGKTFDIHSAGISHIFPHHENEMAIAEAITNKKFVNYWLHHDFVFVDGQKMSKKRGNFYMLNDIIKNNYHPLVLRYVLLRTHFRSKLDFSWNSMQDARELLLKIVIFLNSLEYIKDKTPNDLDINKRIAEAEKNFIDSIENNFNMSESMKSLVYFIKSVNRDFEKLNINQAKKVKEFILKIDIILGCIKPLYEDYKKEMKNILKKIESKNLFKKRILAKTEKNWKLSDDLKKQIEDYGLVVKDYGGSSQFYCELKSFKDLFIINH